MTDMFNDNDYNLIVKDILANNDFDRIRYSKHHGTNRLYHSMKVSFMSYKIAKFMRVDYVKTARAGLLHDFFYTDENAKATDKLKSTINHPKLAVMNANKYFDISPIEANIIASHMYPRNIKVLPKYIESWIVIFSDTVIALGEFTKKFKKQTVALANLWLIILYNTIK